MRMQSSTATCSYGHPSQAGCFFDRRRSAARQDHFARARGGSGMLKRRQRDEEEPEAGGVQQQHRAGGMTYDPHSKRFVLDRLKRMRLSSPPTSPPADENAPEDNTMMTDASTEDKAIVPLPWWQEQEAQRQATLRPVAGAWRPLSDAGPYPAGYQMPPADETCTALVVFDPYQPRSLTASPRIELVESDDDDDAAGNKVHSPTSDEEHQTFVRFEEIPDDEDEPMDID